MTKLEKKELRDILYASKLHLDTLETYKYRQLAQIPCFEEFDDIIEGLKISIDKLREMLKY